MADDTELLTMGHTDHLFYLICHAFKHFLHSGFGIRQVCDICLYANAYGKDIDWLRVLEHCREIRADLFTAALFRIGTKYLTFDPDAACFPEQWREIEVDETMILEDLLDAGIYGGSSMSRKHSSNITLKAVEAWKRGRKPGNSVINAAFPSAKELQARYPYLQKYPFLLPAAWADRVLKYRRELSLLGNDAAGAVEIGNRRVKLLKQYRIL